MNKDQEDYPLEPFQGFLVHYSRQLCSLCQCVKDQQQRRECAQYRKGSIPSPMDCSSTTTTMAVRFRLKHRKRQL